jgi:hypothetical protein
MHTTVPDVDIAARQVTLRVTKNGKTRLVYINDLALQVLGAMGIAERKRHGDRRVLFPGITPAQLSMRFIRACRGAAVEDFSFHDLRHTYASHLRMKGADLNDIRRLLGHSDLRMSIRYAHLLPEHLEAAPSRLDGVLTLPASATSGTRPEIPAEVGQILPKSGFSRQPLHWTTPRFELSGPGNIETQHRRRKDESHPQPLPRGIWWISTHNGGMDSRISGVSRPIIYA